MQFFLRLKTYLSILFLFVSTVLSAQNNRIYVDIDATGANNGMTWADAYTNLQTAIDSANIYDTIWIADGVYIPIFGSTGSNSLSRDKTFFWNKDLMIFGGFSGSETMLSERDFVNNQTILSGDIDLDDSINTLNNSFHVMLMLYLDSVSVIDGVTIKGGRANNSQSVNYGNGIYIPREKGGGIYASGSSVTFRNCRIEGNYAQRSGAGIYTHLSMSVFENIVFQNNFCSGIGTVVKGGGGVFVNSSYASPNKSSVIFNNCSFTNNSSNSGGGGGIRGEFSSAQVYHCHFEMNLGSEGGGIYMKDPDLFKVHHSTFIKNEAGNGGGIATDKIFEILQCTFIQNSVVSDGGALYLSGSAPTIQHCKFIENTATKGGAVYQGYSNPNYTNCIFTGNYADSWQPTAGAVHAFHSSFSVTNCTFSQNTVTPACNNWVSMGAIFTNYGVSQIRNSILWGNSLPEAGYSAASPTYTNCILQSTNSNNWNLLIGIDGSNNIDNDPLLIAPDFHYLRVNNNSPAINSGNNSFVTNSFDLANNTRIQSGMVDIGAYEYGSYSINNQQDTICLGDSILIQNTYLSDSTSYVFEFLDTTISLDSLIAYNLVFAPQYLNFSPITVCNSYDFNGQIITQSGLYIDTLNSIHGCDSIIVLNILVNQNQDTTITDTICSNNDYWVFNNNYNQSGIYIDTGFTITGCDSIVTLNLFVLPVASTLITDSICQNETYIFNNQMLHNSGTYYDTLIALNGCDSLITLNLIVLSNPYILIMDTICHYDTYLFNNQSLNNSGIYYDTLMSLNNCDTFVSLDLTVLPPIMIINSTITDVTNSALGSINITPLGDTLSYQYLWNTGDTTQDISNINFGLYVLTVTNGNGCIDTFSFNVDFVGTNSIIQNNNIQIFPNPIEKGDALQIQIDVAIAGNIDLELMTTTGQILQTKQVNIIEGNNQIYWNLKPVTGLYLLNIKHNNFILKSFSIIIQ